MTTDTNSSEFLTFLLAGEEYGVDILRVQEIKGWDAATRLPNTPAYVKGVINLRGTIVPIVDLRQRFGLECAEYGRTTVVIVLRVSGPRGDRIVGIVVDAVSEVYQVQGERIQPAPELGMTHGPRAVTGLATVDDKMIILLDIDSLLATDEIQSLAA